MFQNILRRIVFTQLPKLISKVENHGNTQLLKNIMKPTTAAVLFSYVKCKPLDQMEKEDLLNYDIDMSTWRESENSIMNLMNVLKDSIIGASHEYRNCLQKQIEITLAATQLGHFAERWDDMPEYRLLADELKLELDRYLTLIKTLGSIAADETLIDLLPQPQESMKMISLRYKELEQILSKEMEENRKLETELLKVKQDSIFMLMVSK